MPLFVTDLMRLYFYSILRVFPYFVLYSFDFQWLLGVLQRHKLSFEARTI